MKEKLIQEISNAMTEILSVEQMAQLNGVLLQVVSKYTITEDGEKAHEEAASNDRLLEIFLSAKILRFYHQAAFQENAQEGNQLYHGRYSGILGCVPA